MFDFASSAASRGDIELHRRARRPLPEGWGIDADGHPTISPQAIVAGAMLPFGGHIGSAIALMVKLLAGPFTGDLTNCRLLDLDGDGTAPLRGELVLAINPDGLGRTGGSKSTETISGQGARLSSQHRPLTGGSGHAFWAGTMAVCQQPQR